MPLYFHVTTLEALPEILVSGLQPRIGPRAQECGETTPSVYAFGSIQALEDAMTNWLGEALENQDGPLAVVEFEATGGEQQAFEYRFDTEIGPEQFHSLRGENGVALDHVLQLAQMGQMWPLVLRDEDEIAEYVTTHATDEVDEDMVRDNYIGTHARLRLIPLDQLEQGPAEANIPSASKQERYADLPIETRPPLLVEGQQIMDGNHRYRDAVARGEYAIWSYAIEDGPAPRLQLTQSKRPAIGL